MCHSISLPHSAPAAPAAGPEYVQPGPEYVQPGPEYVQPAPAAGPESARGGTPETPPEAPPEAPPEGLHEREVRGSGAAGAGWRRKMTFEEF